MTKLSKIHVIDFRISDYVNRQLFITGHSLFYEFLISFFIMVQKMVQNCVNYLDLTFITDSGGKLSTRLYDKRDDFDFHIVNFPFLSSNILSGHSYSYSIRSTQSCYWLDQFPTLELNTWILSKFSTSHWICLIFILLTELPLGIVVTLS